MASAESPHYPTHSCVLDFQPSSAQQMCVGKRFLIFFSMILQFYFFLCQFYFFVCALASLMKYIYILVMTIVP